jgi:iron complex transport system ATP-binding protein
VTIAIEHLDFSYGRFEVLRDVSGRAESSRVTVIIGPNAAGKSTLLRCIIGSLRPRKGRVLIDGQPSHQTRPSRLARCIAYVPQRAIVSAAFTVRQVVELGRYALAPDSARVADAIEKLDLTDVVDRPYPRLSAGQQQRVSLARSIAQLEEGGHLILDEPTSAMDLRHVASCMRLVRELTDRGASVVLAMHDLTLAASIADDVWILDRGRLIAAGTASDVLQVERLRAVFGIGFEWLATTDGRRRLIPHAPLANQPDRMGVA